MQIKKRMLIKITKSNFWYKKGEVHEVGCYITVAFGDKYPCFEKYNGMYGINITDCKILKILDDSIS